MSILVLFIFLGSNFFSQDKCKELFVTEVLFEQQNNYGNYNQSIELFNPTEIDINLSTYKIELVDNVGVVTYITLQGLVPSHGTYVISNGNANSVISQFTNYFSSLLTLEGKVAINLTGPNGEIVDKFGQQGVETTSTIIDISQLLNNPEYLEGLDINLGSIENLLVRRKPTVQNGKVIFQNMDLINEWNIFPNFLVEDLGVHTNACIVPVVSWLNISFATPEVVVVEGDENIIIGEYEVIGLENVGIEIGVNDFVGVFIDVDIYDVAFDAFDYEFLAEESMLVNPGDFSSGFWDLAQITDDITPEEDESSGFWLEVINDNGTGAFVADNVLDILIIDDDATGVQSLTNRFNEIKISPTVATNSLTIINGCEDIFIFEICILPISGKEVLLKKESSFDSIDVSDLSSGYYVILIRTNKGIVSKKFIKD